MRVPVSMLFSLCYQFYSNKRTVALPSLLRRSERRGAIFPASLCDTAHPQRLRAEDSWPCDDFDAALFLETLCLIYF